MLLKIKRCRLRSDYKFGKVWTQTRAMNEVFYKKTCSKIRQLKNICYSKLSLNNALFSLFGFQLLFSLFFILSVSLSGGLNLLSRNRVDIVGGLIKDFYLYYVLLPRPP